MRPQSNYNLADMQHIPECKELFKKLKNDVHCGRQYGYDIYLKESKNGKNKVEVRHDSNYAYIVVTGKMTKSAIKKAIKRKTYDCDSWKREKYVTFAEASR